MNLPSKVLGLRIDVLLVLVAATTIVIEAVVLRMLRRPVNTQESTSSVGLGLMWAGSRLFGAKALMFGTWVLLYEHVALWHVDLRNPLSWVAYWIIGDFIYYWTHRAEHRVRLLWSSHLVHHSSTEFNLAAAVRQPWTEMFYKPIIAMWAPLLGFHPMVYVIVGAVSLGVGQWQHLAWFPKLRLLDAVAMSPSNHRVHHARSAAYIDRNFGGSLVLWDKVFGTYEPEGESPVYGVTHLPPSTSIWGASLGGYPELAAEMRSAPSWRAKAGLAFGRPL